MNGFVQYPSLLHLDPFKSVVSQIVGLVQGTMACVGVGSREDVTMMRDTMERNGLEVKCSIVALNV